MRIILGFLLAGTLLAGCAHRQPAGQASSGDKAKPAKAKSAELAARGQKQKITPVVEPAGLIASVNPDLRFVVIDFSSSQLPKIEQRLGVYRQRQKVGEVKISGPEVSQIIAADLINGEAKVGDEVRPD